VIYMKFWAFNGMFSKRQHLDEMEYHDIWDIDTIRQVTKTKKYSLSAKIHKWLNDK
jgi:hypothetical protein